MISSNTPKEMTLTEAIEYVRRQENHRKTLDNNNNGVIAYFAEDVFNGREGGFEVENDKLINWQPYATYDFFTVHIANITDPIAGHHVLFEVHYTIYQTSNHLETSV